MSVETPGTDRSSFEFVCDICNAQYRHKYYLNHHKLNKHNWNFKECSTCHVKAKSDDTMTKHTSLKHNSRSVDKSENVWIKKIFTKPTNGYEFEYLYNGNDVKEFYTFFRKTKHYLFENLSPDLGTKDIVISVGVCIEIQKWLNGEKIIEICNFAKEMKTFANIILMQNGCDDLVEELNKTVFIYKKKFTGKRNYLTIIQAKVRIECWRPIFIDYSITLPEEIVAMGAVHQPNTNNQYNFKWVIIMALNSSNYFYKPGLVSHYNISDISRRIVETMGVVLDFNDLDFPMPLRDMPKFEEANPTISINVFGYERNSSNNEVEVTGPLYRCKAIKKHHVNLLLIGSIEQNNYRFGWIRHMSRLLERQNGRRKNMCFFCMETFYKIDSLQRHQSTCNGFLVPMKRKNTNTIGANGSKKPIQNIKKQKLALPFLAFANYETIAFKQTDGSDAVASCGFGFYIKCNFDNDLSVMHVDQGPDSASNFVKNLIETASSLFVTYVHSRDVYPLLQPWQQVCQLVYDCCVCQADIPDGEREYLFYKPAMQFIGPSHRRECSQYFNTKTYIPIFLPSLEDITLFTGQLNKYPGRLKVSRDSQNATESISKYVQLLEGYVLEFRFLDLNHYIGSKIDYISELIKFEDFKIMKNVLKDDRKVVLMQQKLFPFKYATSLERLQETELPPETCFDDFGKDAYETAKDVWKEFNCRTLMDFLMVYLQSEILLQIDIFDYYFELFRNSKNGAKKLKSLHYDLKYIAMPYD